jgi:hypothetical protein
VRSRDHKAVEYHLSLRRRVEPRNRAQHGGFPAAGAANHDKDFAGRDLERDAVERAHAIGIDLAHPIEHQHGIF